MAIISGRVIFDRDRSATINAGDTALIGVPVVLQNINSGERLTVLTDNNGNFSFVNVPNGEYRLVESYSAQGGVQTPGDFGLAEPGPIPVGDDPPITIAINPPAGANDIDSLTPNTIFLNVNNLDLTNQNFLDGPIRNIPISTILDECASISNVNLITAASNGTFGFFPAGTPANTGVPTEPYPEVTPDYTYVLPNPDIYAPTGGEYTVQNILTNALSNQIGAWWRIADHTTGDETGTMMIVNGYEPGSIFFTTTISVEPNTNYLFTSWILNLFRVNGYALPEFGVIILDENGNIIYDAPLGIEIPVNTVVPEWKEIGTVINSQNNTRLTIQFLSEGPEEIGNDYVIDDVSLREIEIPTFTPIKTASMSVANIGDVITYTVSLENTCTSPLTNVFFRDIIPNGLAFLPGTVTVNGVQYTNLDPNIGFSLPNIQGGQSVVVTFDVIAEFIPDINPTINTATIMYSYSPVEGGIQNQYTVESNEVLVEIISEPTNSADLEIMKTVVTEPIKRGRNISYMITITNRGPSTAENVTLIDSIPLSIKNVEFSIDGGLTWSSWNGIYNLGSLESGETRIIFIRGKVRWFSKCVIINKAIVTSSTPDPNRRNNISISIVRLSNCCCNKCCNKCCNNNCNNSGCSNNCNSNCCGNNCDNNFCNNKCCSNNCNSKCCNNNYNNNCCNGYYREDINPTKDKY